MLERLSRVDRVLLLGDVVVIVGFLAQSPLILTIGVALVVIGFVKSVARRRRR